MFLYCVGNRVHVIGVQLVNRHTVDCVSYCAIGTTSLIVTGLIACGTRSVQVYWAPYVAEYHDRRDNARNVPLTL